MLNLKNAESLRYIRNRRYRSEGGGLTWDIFKAISCTRALLEKSADILHSALQEKSVDSLRSGHALLAKSVNSVHSEHALLAKIG